MCTSPRWFRGVPACLDFAVTSGLRSAHLRSSARDASAAVLSYEGYKCSYLNTQAHCRAEGMAFIPMIVEGHGGSWGPEAAKFWSKLAKSHALSSGELRATVLSRFLGSLPIIAHRENARTLLRRSPRLATDCGAGMGAATAILAASADYRRPARGRLWHFSAPVASRFVRSRACAPSCQPASLPA